MSTIDQLARDERKDENVHAMSAPPVDDVDVPGRTPPPPDPGPDEG